MKPISIKTTVMLGALGLGGLALVSGGVGLVGAHQIGARLHYVADETVPGLIAITNIRGAVRSTGGLLGRHILAPTREATVTIDEELERHIATVDQALADYQTFLTDEHERGLYDDVMQAWSAWKATVPELRRESLAINTSAATAILNGAQQSAITTLNATIDAQRQYKVDLAAQQKRAGEDAASQTQLMMGALCLIALIAAAGVVFLLRRRVLTPLASMTDAMGQLAAGDNSVVLPATGEDEMGRMAAAVQRFKDTAIEKERGEGRIFEMTAQAAAVGRSQAVIEFKLDGTVIAANETFLSALGYTNDEIVGRHHSMFVEPDQARSNDYRQFWDRLNRGEFIAGKFKRLGKGGSEVWIQATYNPLLDKNGKPFKVVKFATDITAEEIENNELGAKISAIGRSQAVIEFNLDGTVTSANENFLSTLGYSSAEIVGRHHSMFVDPDDAKSADYRTFWDRLNRGEFVADKFRRVGKGGREVWIQASYNPLLDLNGKPFKVIKFAADVTQVENDRKAAEAERAARAAEQSQVVTSLASGLKQLAEGNLIARLTTPFAADYEQLRSDFNDAMGKLQDAMKTIAVNSGTIRSGAGEISQASDDLSRRTEQQAASLEETAAALDEITATVRKTAEGSKQANAVVVATRSDAEASGQVVRETVAAMAEIEKSSKQISQIISVIDEIAFQTNLLALNAGVEAARAGDAGRGFAVVASEVRALAQRSSEAAKEIKELISASTQQVETGVGLVGDAGKALQSIVSKVNEISGMVSEIAASAQEQSTALMQVNTAVNQMDQVTQQNAAMVEQSTAASHSLTQEAAELMNLIGRFQTGAPVAAGRQTGGARAASAPAKGQPIVEQRQRVAKFASQGSAALKADDDWQEF